MLNLPSGYKYIYSAATKTAVKGGASGGSVLVYNALVYSSVELLFSASEYIVAKLVKNNIIFIIGLTYVNQVKDITITLQELEDILIIINDKYDNSHIILGGDLSARIANEGKIDIEQLPTVAEGIGARESMDMVINDRGRKLLDFMQLNELYICNGRFTDVPAQFTYVGPQGNSVIDHVIINFRILNIISQFNVISVITKSDHMPIMLLLRLELETTIEKKTIKWKQKQADVFFNEILLSKNVSLVNLNVDEMA